jgi:hypothetical protein
MKENHMDGECGTNGGRKGKKKYMVSVIKPQGNRPQG